MISVIDNPKLKKKCQIFTPSEVATQMLDLVGYRNELVGKPVLENCCGDGQFLSQIIERYIKDAKHKKLSEEQIISGLEQDIVAYEIDEVLIETSKKRLDEIAYRYGLQKVSWNINHGNFLEKDVQGQYDFVIGNPPYIAYQDLPNNERETLKQEFTTCKKGKFDYSYAFIEKSYRMLSNNGKLVYIIPSNIFKNVFAGSLRSLIKDDLLAVVDFPQDRVFTDALVSPAIVVVQKNSRKDFLTYTKVIDKKSSTKEILKKDLAEKWIFDTINGARKRVGDYFKISNVIATLCNKVFIIRDWTQDGEYLCSENDKIELSLLKKATSPKSKRYETDKNEYIIFPYCYDENNGNLIRYSDEEFNERFPYAVKYLKSHEEELGKRDSDLSAKWFEFGRSQALKNMNQEMVMISSVISEDTRSYLLSKGEIPYAGLYIIPTGEIELGELLTVLNSNRFKEYVSSVGVSVSGSSKRITTKDIENFEF